jgi:hypothetical protein
MTDLKLNKLTKVNYEDDVPEWMIILGDWLVEVFCLQDWFIHVKLSDHPGEKVGVEGVNNLQTRYHRSYIEISRQAKDDVYWRSCVIHEFFHVVNADLTRTVDHIVAMVPEEFRGIAQELFADSLEQQQERICRGMTLLRPFLVPPSEPLEGSGETVL